MDKEAWVKVIDRESGEMVAFGRYEDCAYYGTEDFIFVEM